MHKAGKEIIKKIKEDKTNLVTDIQNSDNKAVEEQSDEDEPSQSKSKKDKKDEISDLDEDLCFKSRRIGKYQFLKFRLVFNMMIFKFCHYHIIQIDERTFLLFCL